VTTIIPSDDFPSILPHGLTSKLEWHKCEYIKLALIYTRGNVWRASRLLGMYSAAVLQKSLKRMDISPSDYFPDCPDCGCGRTRLGPKLRASDKTGYFKCPVCGGDYCRKYLTKRVVVESKNKSGDTGEGENPGAYPPVSKGFGGVPKGTPGKPRVV